MISEEWVQERIAQLGSQVELSRRRAKSVRSGLIGVAAGVVYAMYRGPFPIDLWLMFTAMMAVSDVVTNERAIRQIRDAGRPEGRAQVENAIRLAATCETCGGPVLRWESGCSGCGSKWPPRRDPTRAIVLGVVLAILALPVFFWLTKVWP